MFKKLRNKFLILNLVIISIMMIFAFTAIYLITYNNVCRDINRELHRISEFKYRFEKRPDLQPSNLDIDIYQDSLPSERSVSFSLIIDRQGNIIETISIFDMEADFYEEAIDIVISSDNEQGYFRLDGTHWAFILTPIIKGYYISFLDVTSRFNILKNLIVTFLIVAAIMLIFIYFISRFFANKAIKPIKEAFLKQKQFIADASHELKTPLSVINTNIDVLLSNGDDTINNQVKWLHYIKSEANRMSKLTNDLLYLTQVDYSDIKVVFNDFNLSDTVENIILTMEAIIFENNVTLDYEIEPNLYTCGNIEQLKQVIMILLDNAVKYTNKNGSITLTMHQHRKKIILVINNTGRGIVGEQIDKIFDRFYRIDQSRSRENEGYGLGLAIAKTIVDHHGGQIYAESNLNEKTTFTVELPTSETS